MSTKEKTSKVKQWLAAVKGWFVKRDYEPLHTGHGYIDIELFNMKGRLYGGPYMQAPDHVKMLHGIKMAMEIRQPAAINCPTRDFDVPDVGSFKFALLKAALMFNQSDYAFVGCMGGTGRTGLFMGGMAKLMYMDGKIPKAFSDKETPPYIAYVRKNYKSHAIETKQQEEYLKSIDLSDIYDILDHL